MDKSKSNDFIPHNRHTYIALIFGSLHVIMKLVFVIINLHYLLLSADSFVSELQITLN